MIKSKRGSKEIDLFVCQISDDEKTVKVNSLDISKSSTLNEEEIPFDVNSITPIREPSPIVSKRKAPKNKKNTKRVSKKLETEDTETVESDKMD